MKRRAPPLFGGLALAGMFFAYSGPTGALAAGLYDGTYHGTLEADGANATTCAKRAPVQMTVTDNKLEYNHMGNAMITATVGADGSFSGSAQSKYSGSRSGPLVTTVEGKIAGRAIQAQSNTANYCKYKLQLKKF
jgi:hypothetical protein